MASKIQQVFCKTWLKMANVDDSTSQRQSVWCLRSHCFAWDAGKYCVHLRLQLIQEYSMIQRRANKNQTNERTFWNYWERCCVSSMLFKLIRCNSETSRSLGSQQRGRQSLKIWDEFLKMLFKQLIQLFLKQAITAYYCAFQVNRPKEKRNPPHIFFFFA